jgi:putative membrane protein
VKRRDEHHTASTMTISKRERRLLLFLGAPVAAALIASGIAPFHRGTWFLEVAPVLIAAPIIALTWRQFPLTTLLCVLIALHALVLILGGTYTYARVPLGFRIQEIFGFERNPYDRFGHFMQGFVPVMIAREILLRGGYVTGRRMLAFLTTCVALAFSGFYELIEWWAALALGAGATDFLGTQGDAWDTQADMFWALVGAVAALLLSGRHDREIAALDHDPAVPAER